MFRKKACTRASTTTFWGKADEGGPALSLALTVLQALKSASGVRLSQLLNAAFPDCTPTELALDPAPFTAPFKAPPSAPRSAHVSSSFACASPSRRLLTAPGLWPRAGCLCADLGTQSERVKVRAYAAPMARKRRWSACSRTAIEKERPTSIGPMARSSVPADETVPAMTPWLSAGVQLETSVFMHGMSDMKPTESRLSEKRSKDMSAALRLVTMSAATATASPPPTLPPPPPPPLPSPLPPPPPPPSTSKLRLFSRVRAQKGATGSSRQPKSSEPQPQ
eukprot:3264040-Pleurochrysis_carterae.AAC.4